MGVTLLNTKADFNKALTENKLVAVDFYADWCGPCRMISPKFEAMSGEFPDVYFCKVNVDENDEVSEQQKISAMPTFQFFKDGKQFDDLVGANEAKLREKIQNLCK